MFYLNKEVITNMKLDLTCFKCKTKVSIDVGQYDVRQTANGRHLVNISCPNVKPDGAACGRKMTSLIKKEDYLNVTQQQEK